MAISQIGAKIKRLRTISMVRKQKDAIFLILNEAPLSQFYFKHNIIFKIKKKINRSYLIR